MKIWFFGKAYDLNQMTVEDVEKDIEERLKDYSNVEIGVSVEVKPDGYDVMLHRGLNVEPKNGCILEADSFLISGEGYSGFMPEYQSVGSFAHWPLFTHYFDLPEFEKACKRNIQHYTGNKVKNVKITEYTNLLILHARF